jgi:hypothetical protein
MSLQYTYGTGSTTESKRWSTLDDLLVQIPNNNSNLIYAKDVRDAVFTLWEKSNETYIIAASASSASAFYQNSNLTPFTVGGIQVGSSFSTPQTVQQMFDALLYPYVGPGASISSLPNREYGAPASINLGWSVIRNSNPITLIIVDGQSITPTGNSQTGTKLATGTYSALLPLSTNNFTITVGDGINNNTSSATLTWMNRIYWGAINLISIGEPNLTLNPGSASLVNVTSSTILGLTGASISPGNQLATSKSRTYTNINGSGNYLIFAWPTSVSGSLAPIFNVNGLPNSAFTRVRNNWSFSNQFGLTASYEVWISNTKQNSPLNITIS